MRTKLKAALSVLVVLSVVGPGAAGCGCKDGTASATVVHANANSFGNEADARAPKPKPNKDKPCEKGQKQDTRGKKAKTKNIDRGAFKTRAEAVAARAKDMKGRDPLLTKKREECSPTKCHLHLDIYTRDRRPGNDYGPLQTWHYTYHRR